MVEQRTHKPRVGGSIPPPATKPNLMDLLSRFENILKAQDLVSPRERVFIACSGGPDSSALFYLFKALQKKWKLKLGLLHFNHKLRGRESDRDEAFVKKMACYNGLPFYTAHKPVRLIAKKEKTSLEEEARKLRYEFFIHAAKKYRIKKIAVAHTQEDQAETVLMRVMQGTGLRGLSGIRNHFKKEEVIFIRPLLEISKKDLLLFLKENKISFRRDRSNQSMRFVRNKIREELLPMLAREFNPRVIEAIARIPSIVKEENHLLADLEKTAWRKVFKRKSKEKVYLDRSSFLKFPPALQFRMVDQALKSLDKKSGINFEAWQKLQPNLSRRRFRFSLPKDIDFSITPSKLVIYKKFQEV